MPENNQIFIERHGLVSGDPLEYRSSSLGDIGGLSNDTRYYAYKYNDNWIALAAPLLTLQIKTHLELMILS